MLKGARVSRMKPARAAGGEGLFARQHRRSGFGAPGWDHRGREGRRVLRRQRLPREVIRRTRRPARAAAHVGRPATG